MILFYFIVLFIVMTLGAIWKGYVLTIVWSWFVVPTLGLPALTLVPAIGLALVASFMTYHYVYAKDTRSHGEQVGTAATLAFAYPLLVLGMGWVINQFM